MTAKIKIIKLSKPDDYLDREWAKLLSKRQHLLSSTDWTQISDNGLSYSARLEWRAWRESVREIHKNDNTTLDEVEKHLNELEKQFPKNEFVDNSYFQLGNYTLDISTLDQAKKTAINVLKVLHNDWITMLLPENIHVLEMKYSEMMKYENSSDKRITEKKYPLLYSTKNAYELTTDETLSLIKEMKEESENILVESNKHFIKFKDIINKTNSIDDIVSVVGKMSTIRNNVNF